MITSLFLGAALMLPAAPIPKETPKTGPAPQILELKPGEDGRITLKIWKMEKVTLGGVAVPVGAPNQARPIRKPREYTRRRLVEVGLSEIKDLQVYEASGKEVEREMALAKLKTGGVVVIATDGKMVSPTFLRIFREDTLILVSPELTNLPAQNTVTGRPVLPDGPIQVLPGRPIQILPAGPGGIQVVPAPAIQPQLLPAPKKDVKKD